MMGFEGEKTFEKMGAGLGFFLSYALFTALLYLILQISHKLPTGWNLFHLIAITIIVTAMGILIKRLLK
jgi:hypothetical protein